MKISREFLLNELRKSGCNFKRETKKVEIWKQKGQTKRVTISKGNSYEPEFVKMVLRQVGRSDEDINKILSEK